jgi:signal transduction histidine kinase
MRPIWKSSALRQPRDAGWWLVRPGSVSAFVFALGCVSISTVVRGMLDPILPTGASPFVRYFPTLLFATFWGGLRAGAFALLVSIIASWWLFFPVRHSLQTSTSDMSSLVTFIVSATVTVWAAYLGRRFSDSLSQEISRHQITTTRLKASEETLRLAMHASKLGILEYDAVSDVVRYWGPELYSSVDTAPNVTIGLKAALAFIHPDDRERIADNVRQVLDPRGPGNLDEEFRVKRADNGETRWLRLLYQTYFSDEGADRRPIRGHGVVLDITVRKAGEAEAERQRNELMHLTRVTTLGSLSGGIAHELNQPLASILLNAQAAQVLLDKDNLDREEFRNILEEIVQDDSRAGDVIRRLRSLLRKEKSQPALVSMNELVMSTLRIVQSELRDRKVKVETDLTKSLPTISGDSVGLQQVLLNLIMNAVEAMDSTPVATRTLCIASREGKSEGVEVSIRDWGTGMSPENLKRIHEPFSRPRRVAWGSDSGHARRSLRRMVAD